MLESIFSIGLIAFISFIPIVLWGYLFAYIDDAPTGNMRFFAGVFGGILAVVPIIYLDQISIMTGITHLNSFALIQDIGSFFSALKLSSSLILLTLFIALFSLLSVTVFHKWFSISKIYIKNILTVSIFALFTGVLFYGIHIIFNIFPGLNISFLSGSNSLLESTLQFIIFYYIVVGLVEEIAKHFNFLQSSGDVIKNTKTGVLYAIFIALGFSFIENLLYLYNIYSHSGFGDNFVQTYFFRSIFSVIVHVLCSSIIGYYFSRAYLAYKKNNLLFPYIKLFFIGLFWGILLHAIFDIGLSVGISFIIILYFLGGYFYVTSLLYRE